MWSFSELAGIVMEVEPHEFIFCNPVGGIVHTKQYGKTKPPTVTLKKPMDTETSLWIWHLNAQAGSPTARLDCTLTAYSAGSPGQNPDESQIQFVWLLHSAWPAKMELASMRAGATDSPQITVVFSCDEISIPINGIVGSPSASLPGA